MIIVDVRGGCPTGRWSIYDAIGQHDTTVTPLQEAMFAAAVANGGELMKPYLIDQVTSSDGSVVSQVTPQILSEVSPTVAGYERQMMIAAVEQRPENTVYSDNEGETGISIAAVTGTTRKGSTNLDTVLAAFAPANSPQIAVGVMLKGGNESASAAEGIAIELIHAYLEPSG